MINRVKGPDEERSIDPTSYFPSMLRPSLRSFFLELSQTDADVVIFMARKALRLYDLFIESGFARIDRPIYSHHILDHDSTLVVGKSVLLVDDTMILGTTLRKAKAELIRLGAMSVKVSVFARDIDVSLPEIIVPDLVAVDLSSSEMRMFCAAEVNAFSRRAIPYLSDFPISMQATIAKDLFEIMLSGSDWEAFDISRSADAPSSTAHTFLPSPETSDRLLKSFGLEIQNLCEIVKIRVFARDDDRGNMSCRFVPIVTFRPFGRAAINKVFSDFCMSLGGFADDLNQELSETTSKLRFFQNLLSCIIYQDFRQSVGDLNDGLVFPEVDFGEMARHFQSGACQFLTRFFFDPKFSTRLKAVLSKFKVPNKASLPRAISSSMADSVLSALVFPGRKNGDGPSERSYNADLVQVFVELFRGLELPARAQVRAAALAGATDFDDLPIVNRLKIGVSWGTLIQHVFKQSVSWRHRLMLTCYLDRLIDLGIAVPALVVEHEIAFRIYRHGEDVLLGEQEYALCHHATAAFMESSERTAINRIDAEKLFVMLIKVGAGLRFIDQTLGEIDDANWARVGYHLHGAVIHFEPRDKTVFATHLENWLTTRLQQRGILVAADSGYQLGSCPDAAFSAQNAETYARTLGSILGDLRHGTSEVISETDLAILVSTAGPVETLAALAAELRIFCDRFSSEVQRTSLKVDLRNFHSAVGFRKMFRGSTCYKSAAEGRLKFSAFKLNKRDEIDGKVRRHFSSVRHGAPLQAVWDGFRAHLGVTVPAQNAKEVSNLIEGVGKQIVSASIAIYIVELAIVSSLCSGGNKNYLASLAKSCKAISFFMREFFDALGFRDENFRGAARLRSIATNEVPIEKFEEAYKFGLAELVAISSNGRIASDNAFRTAFSLFHSCKIRSFGAYAWYDIVNSKGHHIEVETERAMYRERVKRCRRAINDLSRNFMSFVNRSNGLMKGRPSMSEDEDDQKKYFFSGSQSKDWAFSYLEKVIVICNAHELRVRCMCLPGNLVGAPPYSRQDSALIEGVVFLETVSVLEEEVDRASKKLERISSHSSHVFLGGSFHVEEFVVDNFNVFKLEEEFYINCEGDAFESRLPFSILRIG